jgi:hypothetical protein
VPVKAQAAAAVGAKTIVCPTDNVNEVSSDLPLLTTPIANLADLLTHALVDQEGHPVQLVKDQALGTCLSSHPLGTSSLSTVTNKLIHLYEGANMGWYCNFLVACQRMAYPRLITAPMWGGHITWWELCPTRPQRTRPQAVQA